MTLEEAIAAMSGWGEPRVLRRPGRDSAKVSSVLDGVGVQALLEGGRTVTAVELWWPGEGRVSGTRVLLDGTTCSAHPRRNCSAAPPRGDGRSTPRIPNTR
ncbi:hypothetical protein ACF1BE_28940 [Streptomyces sp. NPDC014991]|uniref:hypothetical protein n=1 Tax=Streptomyces sp. NPDC014991 TaxID=3364935 RepID=UPI0036FCAE52